jgi:hypothetical protein
MFEKMKNLGAETKIKDCVNTSDISWVFAMNIYIYRYKSDR